MSTFRFGDLDRHATHPRPAPPSVPNAPSPLQGIEVSPEYEEVLRLIGSEIPVVFVSGKAGTGKSTLIHYIRESLKINLAVLAPTGIAALNIKGATIHSFFRLPPRIVDDSEIKKVKDRRLYTKLDLIIIDEISMVRADVMDAIDRFLRLNGPNESKPFGGIQMLLVGDMFQLPPVVTQSEEAVLFGRRYSSPFFFSAKALAECEFKPVQLTRIYRQKDPEFTEILNRVREAKDLDVVIPKLNAACYRPQDPPQHVVTLTCTNVGADRINLKNLDRLTTETRTFRGVITDKFMVEEGKLPSPMDLSLRIGSQVMFTKNDEAKRWMNGTIGRVAAFLPDSVQVELVTDYPGAMHEVQRVTWESYAYRYNFEQDRVETRKVGSYTQFPLMLAWAVTIHKSQGKTLERVQVDLGDGAFATGQVYVALSRCRSLADLTLARPVTADEVRCDERIRRFFDMLFGETPIPLVPPEPESESGSISSPSTGRGNAPASRHSAEPVFAAPVLTPSVPTPSVPSPPVAAPVVPADPGGFVRPPVGPPPGALPDQRDAPSRCPQCDRPLERRSSRFGPFLGCSGYPQCPYTFNL
jgi:ATP-dependent DNA helicase PIF1